jgi:glucuronokinase
MADEGHGVAPARAALAGNPSDGYGGAVLATTVAAFEASAHVRAADRFSSEPASPLVEATVRRFAAELEPAAIGTAVRWHTSIPRAVGLGGSSAIVIATTRALLNRFGLELHPDRLARFALAVETEELGIVAGLQDRVAQAYGGVTFMDFGPGGRYERVDPALLPPLVLAWRAQASMDSGEVHRPLRDRYEQGEPVVRQALEELGSLARSAHDALLAGDLSRFAVCVDASFEARARMLALDPRHVEMIRTARAHGASANYTGSGGAIVAVCSTDADREPVAGALAAIGCATVTVENPHPT